ncbi:glycine betaine ABC transporter substrate-binding protein [Microbacterium sp. STN6]|uniref:glycine betaine ABC transporter substrate-binding protein n=1 Tax=Microbacterium sp. STN6 TaxID=2995588 RepID=UPI002260F7EC|nr:glycine betaine ABC transporter substrate-binding protein [Microbacterium sp. STN6]MCX7522804.1 glycine betaine ABC transporter substrate-binding protein [Microbacterium sp. STN6]
MKKRLLTTIAVGAATVLALGACSAGDSGSGSGSDGPSNGDKKDLKIAVFSGWAEGEAASYLWQQVLEEKGYDVSLESATAGPVFTGVSQGDYDVTFDVWLPNTHKKYWAKYGDKLDDLGAWYKNAPLTVAVNKDAPIDSLADLAANADKFDNKIIGIEPGAGLTSVMNDSVIPQYGLDKMEFQTSSTAAMLAALKKATKEGSNIVVTLWKPHWAYSAFPIKDLKDPKGALGKPDHVDTVARTGFEDDYPTLTSWLKNFSFSDELLADLENKMFNSGADESDYPGIVKDWMADHKDFVDSLTK